MYQIIRYRYDDTNTIDKDFAIASLKVFETKTEAQTYFKRIFEQLIDSYFKYWTNKPYVRNNVLVRKGDDGFNYVWAIVEHNIPEELDKELD